MNISLTWIAPGDADSSTRYEVSRLVPGGATTVISPGGGSVQSGAAGTQQTLTDTYTPGAGVYFWRYRIRRYQTGTSVYTPAVEIVHVNPTQPATTDLCTVYGILDDSTGAALNNVNVTATLTVTNVFNAKGEQMKVLPVSATSDSNGYFELQLYKTAKIIAKDVAKWTIVITNGPTLSIVVPDQYAANLADL